MRMVKGQGQSLDRRYWHERLGFNYRMTNIAAAIGLAQMERFQATLARKQRIDEKYRALMADLPVAFQQPSPGAEQSLWLMTLLLPKGVDRDRLMTDMAADAIETRPVFFCAHQLPVYAREGEVAERFPVAEDIAARGVSLPSYPSLTLPEIERVVRSLRRALSEQGRL
jgi:perosamine synthetase